MNLKIKKIIFIVFLVFFQKNKCFNANSFSFNNKGNDFFLLTISFDNKQKILQKLLKPHETCCVYKQKNRTIFGEDLRENNIKKIIIITCQISYAIFEEKLIPEKEIFIVENQNEFPKFNLINQDELSEKFKYLSKQKITLAEKEFLKQSYYLQELYQKYSLEIEWK